MYQVMIHQIAFVPLVFGLDNDCACETTCKSASKITLQLQALRLISNVSMNDYLCGAVGVI